MDLPWWSRKRKDTREHGDWTGVLESGESCLEGVARLRDGTRKWRGREGWDWTSLHLHIRRLVQLTRVAFYTETSKDVLLMMMVMPDVPPERPRRTKDSVFEDDDNFNSNQPIIGWTREMRFRPLLPQISLCDVGKGRP